MVTQRETGIMHREVGIGLGVGSHHTEVTELKCLLWRIPLRQALKPSPDWSEQVPELEGPQRQVMGDACCPVTCDSFPSVPCENDRGDQDKP